MNTERLSKYPVNLLIDMQLKEKRRVDINYNYCYIESDEVESILKEGYDHLLPEQKVVYNLAYREGLTVRGTSEVIGWGPKFIKAIMKAICDEMYKYCHFSEFFKDFKYYSPIDIDTAIGKYELYPKGIFEAINIDPVFTSGTSGISPDQVAALNDLIFEDLDLKQRTLIDMRFAKGLTNEEMSSMSGVSIQEINKMLYDAVKILRDDVAGKHAVAYGKSVEANMYHDRYISVHQAPKYRSVFTKNTPPKIREAITAIVGPDKMATVANVAAITSKPNWWKNITGIGEVTAEKVMQYLCDNGYYDIPAYEERKYRWYPDCKPKRTDNDVIISALSSFDDGIKELNNVSKVSQRELESIKRRVNLLNEFITKNEEATE